MNKSNIANLQDFAGKIFHVLSRPIVQSQLLVILLIIVLAYLITYSLLRQWYRKYPKLKNQALNTYPPSIQCYTTTFLRYLSTPIFCLMGMTSGKLILNYIDWYSGLLNVAIDILWVFFCFRLFLTICYGFFSLNAVNRYRYRFFLPLFILYIANTILDLLFDVKQLSKISVIKLFDSDLSLGAIFVITIGIYLWIMGVSIVEQLFLSFNSLINKKQTGAVRATSVIIRYSLIGIGIVLLFGYVGVSPAAVAAISGGLSVGLGFSLKEFASNFLSGLGLLFEGSLRPGDVLDIEGEMSTVQKVSVRATTVVTHDRIEKIVPNQYLFTNIVTTYTGSNPIVRLLIPVGVSYSCIPKQVIEILLDVADKNMYVLNLPQPEVYLIGYGDSTVDFQLAVFINNPQVHLKVKTALYVAIWNALAENEIEIPFPQTDIHIDYSSLQ